MMNPGQNRGAAESPKQSEGCVLEFEDLWAEDRLLRGWLETATAGLVTPAKQRIRTEIEAHYREAVAAHVAQGLSEPSAKNAALVELGEPRAAAKRFRRSHLTTKNVGAVNKARRWIGPWGLPVAFLLFFGSQFVHRDVFQEEGRHYLASTTLFAIEIITFIVVPTICFAMARRRNAGSNIRLLVLMPTISVYVWMGSMWFTIYGLSFSFWLLTSMCLGPGFVGTLLLWRKLREVADVWSEIPPSNAASS
jgi:hypothetical protein